MEEVVLSGYRLYEDDRLNRLILLLQIFGQSKILINKVKRLHDYKGELTVVWDSEPTEDDVRIVDEIWCSAFNEEVALNCTEKLWDEDHGKN